MSTHIPFAPPALLPISDTIICIKRLRAGISPPVHTSADFSTTARALCFPTRALPFCLQLWREHAADCALRLCFARAEIEQWIFF